MAGSGVARAYGVVAVGEALTRGAVGRVSLLSLALRRSFRDTIVGHSSEWLLYRDQEGIKWRFYSGKT